MSLPFVKLYTKVLDSSIWVTEDAPTRLLWITLLAMSDSDGVVRAPLVGIAARARITLEEAERGMERLTSPDLHSSSSDHEGRRVEANGPGHWTVLNRRKYWDLRTKEQSDTAARVAKHRANKKQDAVTCNTSNGGNAASRTELEGEGEGDLLATREGGFALRPPEIKAKGTKASAKADHLATVLEGYRRARELAGLPKAWGTYRDTADNRKRAARVCEGRTPAEVWAIFEHIGGRLAAGTFGDPKWAGLDYVQRKMDEYASELAVVSAAAPRQRPAPEARSEPAAPPTYYPEPEDEDLPWMR